MNPHSKTWKDLTPLDRMGTKAAVHPRSTFAYTPAIKSDIRETFARIRQLDAVATGRQPIPMRRKE